MAYLTGADGKAVVGAATIINVTGWTLDIGRDFEESAALLDSWHESTPTLGHASGTIECQYDNTDTNGQVAMQTAVISGADVTLKLYVDGDNYFSGAAKLTLGLNVSAGAVQKATFNFTGNGAWAYT